ncbi:hypothetical protein [Oceanobacillus sp. J11TS1]|uniref:DUF7210 family protein n=1 Tax=Oceanobacillus sp. J11TS1 TaxID=2807191 RepID=UPI001B0D2EFF|nr:hypothetical protein [Oceanobacillus sp. J11TS1]GIO25100.1 hypothetical protein J11TS1_36810 [Oceanobacillus sp. J11TS1]
MPKYTANAYLAHKGKIVKPGEELDLTAKQADFLKDKVIEVKKDTKGAADKSSSKKEEQKETK